MYKKIKASCNLEWREQYLCFRLSVYCKIVNFLCPKYACDFQIEKISNTLIKANNVSERKYAHAIFKLIMECLKVTYEFLKHYMVLFSWTILDQKRHTVVFAKAALSSPNLAPPDLLFIHIHVAHCSISFVFGNNCPIVD